MNILYLAHRIPYPPNKGDKLRALRQIEWLARRHRVWCACFVDDPTDRKYATELARRCHAVAAIPLNRAWAKARGIAGLAAGSTITESFYRHTGMTDRIAKWHRANCFDTVVAFSSSMARYALAIPGVRRVLDMCDLDSRKWADYAMASRGPARWLYRMEARRLEERERNWIEAFDATVLISDAEAADLRGPATQCGIHVVGNGVALPSEARLRQAATERDGASPIVGFVGAMDYRPNVDAVRRFVVESWPTVLGACPDATFRVVGRSPARSVRLLARNRGVIVVGEVDDVMEEVVRFDVSVAPLLIARGVQNKVLEAMAAARPVVLSPQAAKGIAGRDGEEFVIAGSDVAVSSAVIRLLRDPAERRRIGERARRFTIEHHHWDVELAKLEALVRGITSVPARALVCHAGDQQHTPSRGLRPARSAGRSA